MWQLVDLQMCPPGDVQLVPFASLSVLVADPDAHIAHAVVDVLLYCPAPHAVHVPPPVELSVSVTDPAGHIKHSADPTLL